jgi:hypothetical protein
MCGFARCTHLRARMCGCTGVRNAEITLFIFWLRKSALQVPPVETRMTVHRRYQIARANTMPILFEFMRARARVLCQ